MTALVGSGFSVSSMVITDQDQQDNWIPPLSDLSRSVDGSKKIFLPSLPHPRARVLLDFGLEFLFLEVEVDLCNHADGGGMNHFSSVGSGDDAEGRKKSFHLFFSRPHFFLF